jgi:hypothetical protein
VELTVPLHDGLALLIADGAPGRDRAPEDGRRTPGTGRHAPASRRAPAGGSYPTAAISKGILLYDAGRSLAEEGVGFGLPVLKCGLTTVFPGSLTLLDEQDGAVRAVTASYEMNLVERLARPGGTSLQAEWMYSAKNALAALHREVPLLRRSLTGLSSRLRRAFGWETTYEPTESLGTVRVRSAARPGGSYLDLAVDVSGVETNGVTEVVVMNEQGGRAFDCYRDSDGASCARGEIGTWDDVAAEHATFLCRSSGVAFTLHQVEGARLRRGREVVGTRLSWSGFGYSFPRAAERIEYRIALERLA